MPFLIFFISSVTDTSRSILRGCEASGLKVNFVSHSASGLKTVSVSSSAIPELVFTVLFLKILYRIYEVIIHSRVFTLDLPADIDF
jgi:hypothetical protein